jgi:hypothetical protein
LKYSFSGFSYLQNWVANTILKRKTGIDSASIVAMTVPLKQDVLEFDTYVLVIAEVLPLFIIAVFIPPMFRTVFRMVSEKETRMREGMKMMGMKDFPYWMSWLTYHTIINFILSLIVFLILYFTNAISVSSPVILFLTPFLFGESLFGIMMVAQGFFETARMAAIITTFLYLGSSTISELVDVPLYPT